ncbi:hypothetical protein CROQUDRAFT_108527 [Cronartium quercuum f. sp. fusiforme G11]|uniref:Zn(2)-C6 fungal-type domain-containing protein n=1 Tax=Cronartium quercuum f. sp. fusiforme G11 TaxID=708437 RepID=A0A9P6NHU1_9BASI|nr:hypothetical protein CROQUDRAFT_108527 [Cronartium quercuum f. sp. fusiforme G11]
MKRIPLGLLDLTTPSEPTIHIGLPNDATEPSHGPVFANMNDERGWIKVNSVSACKVCRARHVRCSLYRTGGPCDSCREHKTKCEVLGWELEPEAPSKEIYKAVLPPPPPGTVSPACGSLESYMVSPEQLVEKLQWLLTAPSKMTKRKAPMAWPEAQFSMADPYTNPRSKALEALSYQQLSPSNACPMVNEPAQKRLKVYPTFPQSRGEQVTAQESPKRSKASGSNTQKKMALSFILCPSPIELSEPIYNSIEPMDSDDTTSRSCSSYSFGSRHPTSCSPPLSPKEELTTWSSPNNNNDNKNDRLSNLSRIKSPFYFHGKPLTFRNVSDGSYQFSDTERGSSRVETLFKRPSSSYTIHSSRTCSN